MQKSEDGWFEIWWDRLIDTVPKLDHNRPDVILMNRQGNEWTLAEFSVSWDKNMLLKKEEKTTRYIPLAKENPKVHEASTKHVPIILGSLGTFINQLKPNLAKLGLEKILGRIQTSVLIRTHNILRKVMNNDKKEEKEKKKR